MRRLLVVLTVIAFAACGPKPSTSDDGGSAGGGAGGGVSAGGGDGGGAGGGVGGGAGGGVGGGAGGGAGGGVGGGAGGGAGGGTGGGAGGGAGGGTGGGAGGAGGGSGGGGGSVDTTPPTVLSTIPSSNATGVALNSDVTITFSEALDPATVTTSNVTIAPGTASVTYDSANNAIVLTPTAQGFGQQITVTLGTGITDVAGNALAQSYSLSYTTFADTVAPTTTASPATGLFNAPFTVTLTCADSTPGTGCVATRYTTDGSTPTNTSTIYSGPISISATTTLKFFSVDAADNAESIQTALYVIDSTPPQTTATPGAGTYSSAKNVVLTCSDASGSGCAATYYTTDGSTPTTSSSTYSAPISISAGTTLKFFSTDLAGNAEPVRTAAYVIDTAAPTTSANPAGGSYTGNQTVTLSCSDGTGTGCAATYYTTNGSTPTTTSAQYTAPITLSANTTLKFFSTDAAGNAEPIKTESYVIVQPDTTPPTTTATPPGGTYNANKSVALTCTDGATGSGCSAIYYTVDGSTPTTSSAVFGPPISITANTTLKFFAVDNSGNQEAVKTATYVLDKVAPTTTSNPQFSSTVYGDTQVTLTCADNAGGSGCSVTKYSLNGGPYVTYTGPFTITSTSTVDFYSIDVAGNYESNNYRQFTVDRTPPTVVSVSPANNGATSVLTQIKVVFSKRMDPATLNGSTFLLTGGATGTVTYSSYTQTATFVPNAPLNYSSSYTFTVTTGAKDEGGNALGSAFTSSFTTMGASTVISGSSAADMRGPVVAFNNAGKGIALWYASKGNGNCETLYSVFDPATQTWSAEATPPGASSGCGLPTVASNGTGFLVAYSGTGGTTVRPFDGTNFGAAMQLPTGASPQVMASNGTGYAIAWIAYVNGGSFSTYYVRASVFDGTTWTTPTDITTGYQDGIELVSGGSSYVLTAWSSSSVLTVSVWDGASWNTSYPATGVSTIAGTQYTTGRINCSVAWNGSKFRLAWGGGNGHYYYSDLSSSNTWGTAVDFDNYPAATQGVRLISKGSGDFAVLYGEYGTTHLRIDTGTGFGAVTNLGTVGNLGRAYGATNGTGYAFEWTRDTGQSWYATYNGAWSAAIPLPATAMDPIIARQGNKYRLLYNDLTATAVQVFALGHDGTTADPSPAALLTQPHLGAAQPGVKLAVNSTGQILAVWPQWNKRGTSVFASFFNGSTWSAAAEVAANRANVDVASDGTNFMVTYLGVYPALTVFGRPYTVGSGFGTETALSATGTNSNNAPHRPRVASDGTRYLVVWAQSDGTAVTVYGNSYGAGAWSGKFVLEGTNVAAGDPAVAGSPGNGLMVVWGQGTRVYANNYKNNGASYGPSGATIIDSLNSNIFSGVEVGASSSGFAAAWMQSNTYLTFRANLFSAGAWGTSDRQLTLSNNTAQPYVVSDGTGYLIGWADYQSVYATEYASGTWSAIQQPISTGSSGSSAAFASNGSSYETICSQTTGGPSYPVNASRFSGSAWGGVSSINDAPGFARTPVLVAAGSTYVAAYLQPGVADPSLDEVRVMKGF